ncbi:MAG: DUF5011 domain-containing protein, partial [Bacteroidota bacterium]|nr:DUF5011 domain-containing protein [Bacteroidota bacterium]
FYQFSIEPCGASQVTLTFYEFNLGAGDNLKVFDGRDNSAPSLGTFAGTTIPAAVVGTSGALFLEWTSNGSGTGPGFKAGWTSVIPNNGTPTANFSVPDTVYACSLGNDVEFINTSTGVVTGQASYDWIFDYDPNVSYPSSYADLKDEENPTWQYMSNGTYNVRMILKSCEGNDTMVKSFVVDNTNNVPIVDFTTTKRIIKVGETSDFKAAAIAACEYEWVITPNTYEIENGGTETDPVITVKFTAPASYSIRLNASNDNGSSFKEYTNHVDVIDYCRPATTYPTVADIGITLFEFNDFSNETQSGKAPGYSNYTNEIGTSVLLGETYSYRVERPSTVNNVNMKIWVDYNRDGDFDDANELVANEINSNAGTFTGTITIPGINDLVPGEARMRVAMGLANTSLNPCGPNQVGEYEDYALFLNLDDQIPTITLIGGDTSIEIHTQYVDPGATAFDNIEGNITSRIMSNVNVDTAQAGIYFVTYMVSDLSGNQAATAFRRVQVVEDLTEPTLTLNGANPLLWSVKVPFVDPGFNAVDMPSNANVDHLVNVNGTVNVNMIGDYILTYEVVDPYGNATTENRTVQVRDTTAPSIDGNATQAIQVGMPFVDPIIASDNFDMTVKPMVIAGSVNSYVIGVYTQTYSVMDASGNMGQNRTITFEVADYIAPTIIATPGTQTVYVNVFDNNWENAPGMKVTAVDNYYQFADLTKTPSADFDINKIGTYTITYEATDKAGNSSTWVRTVIVRDTEAPIVVATSVNLPRWSSYDFTQGVSVIDNYNTPLEFRDELNGCKVDIIRSNVDFNYPGVYQVTYVATDGSGNRSAETNRLVIIGS